MTPTLTEMLAVAERLGMHFSPAEAELYQRELAKALGTLEHFVQLRLDESKPSLAYPKRDPGYRPDSNEDALNAWVWKCRIEGASDGLLAGKTVSYKDHVAVAGVPVSFGSYALDGVMPDIDATIVVRVLEAGGTIVGKNTTDGLGGMPGYGRRGDYGRPLNPHRRTHLSGGSSSGSAVALVAREVDISFGGDQGGSIRIPAAWCGTVGLKPTFGLVSHFGIGYGAEPSIDHTGPMALHVEDVAAALQAVAGYDGYDPRQGREVPAKIDALSGLSRGVAGLKIGIVEEGFAEPMQSGVREAVLEAIEVLRRNGAQIERISIPEHQSIMVPISALNVEGARAVLETGFFGAFARTYYPPALTAAVNKLYQYEMDRLTPHVKLRYLVAEFSRRAHHGMVYAKAHNARRSFIRAYDDALSRVDVLVMPTCLSTAPIYEPAATDVEAVEQAICISGGDSFRNTFPLNYTGHPALAVPCGKVDGLPVSLQLIGRHFDDALLLQVACAYQHSVAWEKIIGVDAVPHQPQQREYMNDTK